MLFVSVIIDGIGAIFVYFISHVLRFFFFKYIVFISFSFVHTNITRSNHTTWLTVGGLYMYGFYFARLQQNLSVYIKLCMIARDNPYIGENEVNVL